MANAPVSWGIMEPDGATNIPYGLVLDEMRETGYAGTELGGVGYMPTASHQLRHELAARDLKLLASWVSVFLGNAERHADSEAEAVRTARLPADVGGPQALVVLGSDLFADTVRTRTAGRISPTMGLSEAQWQVLVAGAHRVANAVKRETGLRTVFHYHIGTWVETPAEIDTLLRLTDPDVIGLCFDTGHYRFGGGDPVAGLHRHAERVWYVHFKDHQPEVAASSRRNEWDALQSIGHGVFCELGRGDVDFPAAIRQLDEIGYDGWAVVEQDVLPGMGTPRESAQRNREYLRSLGL